MSALFKRQKYIFLTVVIFLGLFLRFFMLGQNPPSLNWDEASTGYNAFSILKTGKDEYGNFLPLSIRSFDDYKPPLYTYLDIPFIAIFGLNEVAVRLPSAVLGTLTIPLLYFSVLEFFSSIKKGKEGFDIDHNKEIIALLSSLFFAVSPWSLQFSRAAYEGNIGVFFLMGAVLFFLKSFKNSKYIFFSTLFFALSMYSYHSFRLVVPVLLIAAFLIFLKEILSQKKLYFLNVLLLGILILPIFYSFFQIGSQGAGSRLSMVTLFGPSPNLDHSITELSYDKSKNDFVGEIFHNRRIVYFLAISKGYLDHFSPDFLFLHGDGGRQHHAVEMGMMYLFDLPLILLGFILISRNLNKKTALLLFILLIAPIPSAITTGTPHPVRAIAMLPPLIILSSIGFLFLIHTATYKNLQIIGKNFGQKYLYFFIILICVVFNFTYYIHQYYIHTPIEYGDFWQYGYKEAFSYAKEHEGEFKRIIVTYKYDQPYVYYLFYNKIDPSWYQKNWNFTNNGIMPRFDRKIGKYEFKNINFGQDQVLKETLLIGSPDEIPEEKTIKRIFFLNHQEAFRIAKT